jgi:hypothetical protein
MRDIFKIDLKYIPDYELDRVCDYLVLDKEFFTEMRDRSIRTVWMDYDGAVYFYQNEGNSFIYAGPTLNTAPDFHIPEHESILHIPTEEEVDKILDRVYWHGIQSLTPIQRKKLDLHANPPKLSTHEERENVLPDFFRIDLYMNIRSEIERLIQLINYNDGATEALLKFGDDKFRYIWMDKNGNIYAAQTFYNNDIYGPHEYPYLEVPMDYKDMDEEPSSDEIDELLDQINTHGPRSLRWKERRMFRNMNSGQQSIKKPTTAQ